MKKRTFFIGLSFALILMVVIPVSIVWAASTTITCTVTAQLISVSVKDGSVNYGTVALNQTKDTATTGDTQTITNDGTVPESFHISSSDAIHSGGTNWILSAAPGLDQFTHSFMVSGDANWQQLPPNESVSLASSVPPAGTVQFDLQIGMPTSVTDSAQHSITVTITATQ